METAIECVETSDKEESTTGEGTGSQELVLGVNEGNRNKKKRGVKLQRTEPMNAYACYVQAMKLEIGTKNKLDMKLVNSKWRNMTPSEKVPFVEKSLQDKLSLGMHYRENRKR